MRVAIIGGTGFIGGYLVDALVAAGHQPALLVRPGSEDKVRQTDECRIVVGELDSSGDIDEVLRDCDAVIYAIGILRENRSKGITFEELQYSAVARIADAANSIGIRRFLLMSAKGVEACTTPYQQTKFRAENYIRAAGFHATVMRPSVVFGPPRGTMEIATQLLRDMVAPPIPAIGFFQGLLPSRGPMVMSPVYVEDVALAFVNALDDSATVGHTYELGGPEALSWVEMIRRIAEAVGRRKWIIPFPVVLMSIAATLLDWLPFFPVTRDQLTMLRQGNCVPPDQLEALTGRAARAFSVQNLEYLGQK